VGLEERTVGLTSYIMPLPSSTKSTMMIIALGFLFGILLAMIGGKASTVGLLESGGQGLFLLSLPAFLSAVSAFAVRRELKWGRMLFLAFIGASVYAVFYLLAVAMGGLHPESTNLVFVGYGLSFIVWYSIAKIVFRLKYSALLFALLQLTYNAIFFLASEAILLESDVFGSVVKFYLVSGVFLISLYAIFWLINAPLKRNFGISGIEALSLFIAQWLRQSSEIEEMFDSVGQEIETTMGLIAFRGKKRGAVFIVPNVHYGPIGNLGGSEFPKMLAERAEENYKTTAFVFHGTATHDFNPVSNAEIEGVWNVCNEALRKLSYERVRGDFAVGSAGNARAYCLKFGKSAFIGLTRAPRTTEDIDFSLGLAIGERARSLGVGLPIVCDAHNAEKGEITRVDSGDPIGFEYMDAMQEAVKKAKEKKPVQMGTAVERLQNFEEAGIGENGVRCAAFSFGKKKYVLMLFDGNGMLPPYRKELIGLIERETGFRAEVYTTDTHSINLVRGVLNPVGVSRGEEIKQKTLKCVKSAIKRIEPVEVGSAIERFRIKVIGPRQASEFIGTVNSIVAVAKIAVPLVLIATVLLVLWAITKI